MGWNGFRTLSSHVFDAYKIWTLRQYPFGNAEFYEITVDTLDLKKILVYSEHINQRGCLWFIRFSEFQKGRWLCKKFVRSSSVILRFKKRFSGFSIFQ